VLEGESLQKAQFNAIAQQYTLHLGECSPPMKERANVWIVVPAYNEAQVIGEVLNQLCQLPYNVVVVDDGSVDHTYQRALDFPVTVLRHVCNLGQGAALQTGIEYALLFPETEFIVTFDSDGQHGRDSIAQLLDSLKTGNYDVALGSRFLRRGDAVNINLRKQLTLKLAILLTRITTGLKLTDTHNGLRAFTAKAAAQIKIKQNRMAHASEILSQISELKLRYCEIPVTITYTEYSKVKGQKIVQSINIIWDMLRSHL